ncbi:Uncharacterised protein [Mycolicibacterium vanbaalenii]|uniref:Uncharacterized protein n=1 Tax=Mycolicibacterium vanbaalenii TaxID=110539 RepID=A0A5S9R3G3_MYCVN|nr:hypothetical protein [Mycolicibacterium vanbaalenii]CAA0127430.1 Uncharacterised protein [Mycolicibacterium vanbaalenii]
MDWEGILRCQTWNVWPAGFSGALAPIDVEYGAESPVRVTPVVDSYQPRNRPEQYASDEEVEGPPLWDGELPGLHRVWDAYLKAPEDSVPLTMRTREPYRGELEIWLKFEFDADELPATLFEALRSTAYEILALLNLRLAEFLVPQLPFQTRRLATGEDRAELTLEHRIAVFERHSYTKESLPEPFLDLAHFLTDPRFGDKFRVSLELYAAHFAEQQVRVRFILLVIAMEALAEGDTKHQVALDLLSRWRQELNAEKAKHEATSDEFYSLDALSRELDFRGRESIGNQIRKLFVDLPGFSEESRKKLQRMATEVYTKRSTLVHDGYLPAAELPALEVKTRNLLKVLYRAAVMEARPEASRFEFVDTDSGASDEAILDT